MAELWRYENQVSLSAELLELADVGMGDDQEVSSSSGER